MRLIWKLFCKVYFVVCLLVLFCASVGLLYISKEDALNRLDDWAASLSVDGPVDSSREIGCIALGIYREAGNQIVGAQKKLGGLIVARAADPQFADTNCGVLAEKIGGAWQFTFMASAKKRRYPKSDDKAWRNTVHLADEIFRGLHPLRGKWKCVRWVKRTDDEGVSERGKGFFEDRLVAVFPPLDKLSFYCKKRKG